LYAEWEYWMMDVDWFDVEEVADFVAEDSIFCDFDKYSSSITDNFNDFTEYPWWWGAVYCLKAFAQDEDVTDADGNVTSESVSYTKKAWEKTDDFTGF
jgi:hypothetical protein